MRGVITGVMVIASLAKGAETCEEYWSHGNRQAAVDCFEKAVTNAPKDGYLHYRLGILYRELHDERRAAQNLQAAIENGFRNLGAQVNLVEAAFASRQSVLAVQTAAKVIQPDLKSPDALLRLGRLLFDHLFYKEALKAFELAHSEAPDAFEPRFRLALTQYLLKEYKQTVAALQSAPELESSPEAASLMASAEAQLGQVEAAQTRLKRALEVSPESPHPYMNLALIELNEGNANEAERLLEGLRALPSQNSAKVFYEVHRNSCRDLVESVKQDSQPAKPGPQKAEYYYQLANQLQTGFQYGSALGLIRLAQTSEGDTPRVLAVAGTSCLNLDPQSPESVQLLQEAVAKDPRVDSTWYLLGRAYMRRGNMEEARKAFSQATQLRADPSYFLALGRTLAKSEDDQTRALASFDKALTLNAHYAEAHLEKGRSLIRMKDADQARDELLKVLDLEPDFYEADYLLARLYFRKGKKAQAQKYMDSFEAKKDTLLGQAVIGSGFVFGGE